MWNHAIPVSFVAENLYGKRVVLHCNEIKKILGISKTKINVNIRNVKCKCGAFEMCSPFLNSGGVFYVSQPIPPCTKLAIGRALCSEQENVFLSSSSESPSVSSWVLLARPQLSSL